MAAGIDDGLTVFNGAVGKVVLAQVLPDIFLRV